MITSLDYYWPDLFVRFISNLIFAFAIVRGIYYPISKRKDFSFTYMLISNIIFFLVSLLGGSQIGIGFAFGMFAIFGIIRYRTIAFPIKEMTYLFVVIGMAVVNAVQMPNMSLIVVMFANIFILIITYVLERIWFAKNLSVKQIKYEKIELITPDKYEELLLDLSERTGLKINRVEIGEIDFLRDTVQLEVYFLSAENPGQSRGNFREDL